MRSRIIDYLSHNNIEIYIPDYKALYIATVVFGILFSTIYAVKRGLPGLKIYLATLLIVIFSFMGGKIYYILENLEYRSHSSFWTMMSGTGIASYGAFTGSIFSTFVVLRLLKLEILAALDVYAPTTAMCISISRLGCFMNGCCYGKISELPWAVSFPINSPAYLAQLGDGMIIPEAKYSLPVHPTQIYELLFGLALFVFLLWLNKKKKIAGISFFVLFASYSVFRFFIEFLRGDSRSFIGSFSVPQIFSLIIITFSILGFLYCLSKDSILHKVKK